MTGQIIGQNFGKHVFGGGGGVIIIIFCYEAILDVS